MYIRYPHPAYISRSLVRDVRFFSVEQTAAPDDEEGDFYAICDASIEPVTHYCNDVILSLSSYLLGGDEKVLVGGVKYRDDVLLLEPDESLKELAYFNSPQAALKVFNAICAALDAGKQYFDLTAYDENGNLEQANQVIRKADT